MTIILICTLILLIALIICCISLCSTIEKQREYIMDRVNNLECKLFDEIEGNWQAIQELKSDISYFPKKEEKGEKLLDPRNQKHLPYVNPAWDDHPLYSIAKSLHSLNKYFTHSKE